MSATALPIPAYLRSAAEADGPSRLAWVARLPATVADLCRRWRLDLGAPFEPGGSCAWVAPGTESSGREVVLKVAWVHTESRHEAEGLAALDGVGAARVHRFEHVGGEGGDTTAMLIERCRPGELLRSRPEAEQHVAITDLLRRIWAVPLPVDHPFRPLAEMCDQWADEAEEHLVADPPDLDPGLVRAGLAQFRALPRATTASALLCTDLHAGNVLSSTERTGAHEWLVIDPKPYVGDPHYDVLQHLLNCEVSLRTDPVGLLTRVAELAELDVDRVRSWLFARLVQETVSAPPPWRVYDDPLLRQLVDRRDG